MHNNDTNEDFIVENFKMNGDEIINENGDIYKILSHEQRRSKIRYNVQLKMKKTVGGCNCQDPMVHQAYRNFLDSLNPEDQQGFRELLTGQPDIDTDLIDSNHTNPEIRQKFKQSGIANLKLQLTPKQRTQLIFGKTKRGKNYNLVSDAQLKVSEKYFNMRPDDLQSLRNQSLLTQIKQQVDENDVTQPNNVQQPENENNDEIEEINMDDDIEQPTTPTNNVVDLIGQARKKKASKQKRYNKLYYQNITLDENDNDFLNTGIHNFKFRTFRMNQTLSEDDQQQLELFDELKHSIISSPLTEEQIQGKGRRRKFFNQPMNEEPNQDYNEDVLNNAGNNNDVNVVGKPQQENIIQNTQNTGNQNANTQNTNTQNTITQNTNTQNADAANTEQNEQDTQSEQEQSGDISVIDSSTSGDEETSEGTSEGETSSEDSIIPLQENQEHEKLYRRLLNEEDEFELI